MARTPASRIQRVQPPATLAAGEKARQLARQGHDVIDLGQSSPHHVTPPHIVEAGINALHQGLTNISSSRGLPELRQAMADKLAAHNGRTIDPDGDILITPGSKMGLYDAINAYIERGDEALVIEPTWVSFSQQVEMAEGIPVAVPLSEEEEYYITYEQLREYVTPQSKMLIINNPNNPTGRVYTREELEAVARVAIETRPAGGLRRDLRVLHLRRQPTPHRRHPGGHGRADADQLHLHQGLLHGRLAAGLHRRTV